MDTLKTLDTFHSCFNLVLNLFYFIFEIHFLIYQMLNIQDSALNKIATVFLFLFWQSSFFCYCHKCATIFCLGTVAAETFPITINIRLVFISIQIIYQLFKINSPIHTVAIWTFTFHKKLGCVQLVWKANFKRVQRPN